MVATSRQQQRGGSIPPVTAARWALWGFVIVNVAIVEILFFTAGTGKNDILTVAKFFGMHAALVLFIQLVLISRLPWLDRRIGMDRLTVWHRWVGFTLLWTILTHATIIVLGYATLDDTTMAKTFVALAGVPASLLGMCAAAIIVVVGVTSTRAIRRRLRYETWHAIHLALYLALALAFTHQLLETTTFKSSPFARVYWWALWLIGVGSLVIGRIVVPLVRNRRHRFQVEAVVPESDNVTSVYVTGRDLHRLPARAGQFFIWHFPGHNHWWVSNPFSMSAAPNGRSLRLTAKAVGATSAGLRNMRPGTRAFLEGPYGAFTSLHRSRHGVVLIAGGVGVTPVRALLEEPTAGDFVVLYRARDERDAVLLNELRQLAAARGARLHLITGRTSDGVRPFEPAGLHHLVPDITERDVYVCGPPAMTSAVLASLRALRVPSLQVHAEKFSMA
jgi:predicted ferric reductase